MGKSEKRVERRTYLKYAGAAVAIVAVAGAGYYTYEASRAPPTTPTPTLTIETPPWLGKRRFQGATLTVKQFNWKPMDVYKLLIPSFENATGAKVNYDSAASWDDLESDVLRDLTSGAGKYDCFITNHLAVPGIARYIFPVTEWVKRDWDEIWMEDIEPLKMGLLQYDPQAMKGGKGDWIGLPFLVHGNFYIYRKDLAEAKGLKPPTTISEFEEFLKALHNPPNMYALTQRGKSGRHILADATFMIQPFGGRFLGPVPPNHPLYYYYYASPTEDLRPTIRAEETIRGVKFFVHLLKTYCPPGVEEADDSNVTQNLKQSSAASTWGENWQMLLWDPKEYLGPDAKWGFTPPLTENYDFCQGAVACPNCISVHSKNKELAWEWIKWTSSKEAQRIIIPAGGEPLRLSTLKDPDLVKMQPWLPALEKSLKSPIHSALFPEYPQFEEIMGSALHEALIGKKTVEEALDWAHVEVDKLMREAGYYKHPAP